MSENEIIFFLGENMWLFITGFVALLFKEGINNILSSLMVFAGNDINSDDVLIIDGRLARVVRVSPMKTTFYVYLIDKDGSFINGTRMQIENSKLKDLKIEKPLPLFDKTLVELHKTEVSLPKEKIL